MCRAYSRGFTLVEALLAIFILTVGVAGALGLIVLSTRSSFEARNIILANAAAESAVEFVRNRRDTNMVINRVRQDQGQSEFDSFTGFPAPGVKEYCKYADRSTLFILEQDAVRGNYMVPAYLLIDATELTLTSSSSSNEPYGASETKTIIATPSYSGQSGALFFRCSNSYASSDYARETSYPLYQMTVLDRTASDGAVLVTGFVWWSTPGAFDVNGYPRPSTNPSSPQFCSVAKHCVFSSTRLSQL